MTAPIGGTLGSALVCGPAVHRRADSDRYSEATKLQLVKYDIAGSRNVSSDLFLFGAQRSRKVSFGNLGLRVQQSNTNHERRPGHPVHPRREIRGGSPPSLRAVCPLERILSSANTSLSSCATYRPSDSGSVSGSYTLYHNSQSVQNTGHNASLSGSLAVSEDFEVNGAVRYLSFNQNSTSLDDYNAVVVSLGLEAKF